MAQRPGGRQKHITEGGTGVHRRGEGLGTGPVGSGSNFHGGGQPSGNRSSSAPVRGGGISMGAIAILLVVFFLFRSLGGSDTEPAGTAETPSVTETQTASGQAQGGTDMGSLLTALLGGGGSYTSSTDYGDWKDTAYQTGQLNTAVADGAREKRTVIRGGGDDTNVILIYLCGTDLESKSGMASRDLQEMIDASINDHVRIYVYTGGCRSWQNRVISSGVNQIYEVADNGMRCLESNMGTGSMVDPATLVQFLNWAKKNTSGNRYDLIFWDHGGGSVSGYGYDEKNPRAGSMDLANIGKALKQGGLTYDFVGFDACLMATVETGLVVSEYADYMIASEETEPGVGWYYTTWLTELSKDPGKPTVEIGKCIADTFTTACASSAPGQKTTLSVVDLAELSLTVPESLKEFASSTSKMISDGEYAAVSDARRGAREFAASSKLDQVDLVHLAMNMGTEEGQALAERIRGAVKYNMTSENIPNSYGLSIYFPAKRLSNVDSAVNTYEAIGMDESYTRMIQEAASMSAYGQAAAGGPQSAYESMTGGSSSLYDGADALTQLLSTMLSGNLTGVSGLTSSNCSFLDRGVAPDVAATYISENSFPDTELVWQEDGSGNRVLCLDETAWSMVQELVLNMFYDDGEGYVDLGLDNVYEFDDNGNLLAPQDRTWVSIEGQPVAYYYIDQCDGAITGYVPAMLNDERVNLLVTFDDAHPYGVVIGANYDYEETGIEVIAKNLTELVDGDRLDFLADFYTYDGEYSDSYFLGETLTVSGAMEDLRISNTDVGSGRVRMLYRLTDIYNKDHWTPAVEG